MTHTIVSLRSVEGIGDAFDSVRLRTVPKKRYSDRELVEISSGADGLFVHSENEYAEHLFEKTPGLRVIGRPGSGLDNIDLNAASAHDVAVVYTPGMNAVAVAEFVVGVLISHIRSTCSAETHVRTGGWRSPEWWGTELRGKTVGIVGLGAAGYETAKRLRPFEISLLVADPYVDPEKVDAVGATLMNVEELVAESDVVSLHVRLTDETRHLIDRRSFERMKSDAVLVNTARGNVVDHDALVDALRNDEIGGAVLDVFPSEPPDSNSPLFELPSVTVTPHLAGATVETRIAMLETTARNVVSVLDGESIDPRYLANPAVFD